MMKYKRVSIVFGGKVLRVLCVLLNVHLTKEKIVQKKLTIIFVWFYSVSSKHAIKKQTKIEKCLHNKCKKSYSRVLLFKKGPKSAALPTFSPRLKVANGSIANCKKSGNRELRKQRKIQTERNIFGEGAQK